jgi:hypothetical protein
MFKPKCMYQNTEHEPLLESKAKKKRAPAMSYLSPFQGMAGRGGAGGAELDHFSTFITYLNHQKGKLTAVLGGV